MKRMINLTERYSRKILDDYSRQIDSKIFYEVARTLPIRKWNKIALFNLRKCLL